MPEPRPVALLVGLAIFHLGTPRAVQLTEKLITEDKVSFVFSPFGSGATKASSNVSEKYKVVTISSTGSSEEVYDQGFKYLFGTLATVVTGEVEISWAFVLLDIPLVALAALCGLLVARRHTSRTSGIGWP